MRDTTIRRLNAEDAEVAQRPQRNYWGASRADPYGQCPPALLRFDHEVVRYWRRLEEIEAAGGEDHPKHAGATGNAARERYAS